MFGMPHTEYWTLHQEAIDRNGPGSRDNRKISCGRGSDDIDGRPSLHWRSSGSSRPLLQALPSTARLIPARAGV